MFISIERQKEKRRPHIDNWIYKDPFFEDYDESDPDPWKYKLTGEKIPRSPEWKIIVKLRHTYRHEGKVKGKSSLITTISYWDFIEQWIEAQIQDYDNDSFYVPEKKLDSALIKLSAAIGIEGDSEILMSQLNEKLKLFQANVLEDYMASDEYGYVQKHIAAWKECIRLRQEAFLKEWEEKERKKKAEENSYRERARYNNEHLKRGGSLDFSDNEEMMFREVWKVGYRALSIKLHPDKGGDEDQMKMLNGLKDKLGSMVK